MRANIVLNGPRGKPHQPKKNDVMFAFLAEEMMQFAQPTTISFLLEVKRRKLFTVMIKKALRGELVEWQQGHFFSRIESLRTEKGGSPAL